MSQTKDELLSFTPSVKSRTVEEMIKTFMSCQMCKKVSTRLKKLHCDHTICQRCAKKNQTRRTGKDDHWMVKCLICNRKTTWQGNNLKGLKDNISMQELVGKTGNLVRNHSMVSSTKGHITLYGEEDVIINIVSFAKEKAEIEKAFKSAEKKMQLCKQQTKQVKEHEKQVNDAKAKIRKQVKRSVESYIAAIRSRQAHMMEEIDKVFQKDYKPIKEAKEAIEVQMQSLKLVTQCCCTASRILKTGETPLDLENFKRMVWKTMKKTKAGKLPTDISNSYTSQVFYISHESRFQELAETFGKITLKKQVPKRCSSTRMQSVDLAKITAKKTAEYSDKEPIYDLPPKLEVKYAAVKKKTKDETELNESIYDEVPLIGEYLKAVQSDSPETHSSTEVNVPMPLKKNSLALHRNPTQVALPNEKNPTPLLVKNTETGTLDWAAALVLKRRRAINGRTSDQSSDVSLSTNATNDDKYSIPKLLSRRCSQMSLGSRGRARP